MPVESIPGRVHISVRPRLFGKFLLSSALKILKVREYVYEYRIKSARQTIAVCLALDFLQGNA